MKNNQTNIYSIVGFVLSLISIKIPIIGILGLIFCIIGLKVSKSNKWLAIAGIVISGIMSILLILGMSYISLANIFRP